MNCVKNISLLCSVLILIILPAPTFQKNITKTTVSIFCDKENIHLESKPKILPAFITPVMRSASWFSNYRCPMVPFRAKLDHTDFNSVQKMTVGYENHGIAIRNIIADKEMNTTFDRIYAISNDQSKNYVYYLEISKPFTFDKFEPVVIWKYTRPMFRIRSGRITKSEILECFHRFKLAGLAEYQVGLNSMGQPKKNSERYTSSEAYKQWIKASNFTDANDDDDVDANDFDDIVPPSPSPTNSIISTSVSTSPAPPTPTPIPEPTPTDLYINLDFDDINDFDDSDDDDDTSLLKMWSGIGICVGTVIMVISGVLYRFIYAKNMEINSENQISYSKILDHDINSLPGLAFAHPISNSKFSHDTDTYEPLNATYIEMQQYKSRPLPKTPAPEPIPEPTYDVVSSDIRPVNLNLD